MRLSRGCGAQRVLQKNTEISVYLLGGELRITYTDQTVFMEGAATLVYTGEVEI